MAKKLLIALGACVVLLVIGLGGFALYTDATYLVDYSSTPYPTLGALDDEEKIARGKYLVEAVAHCARCHTPHDEAAHIRPAAYPSPSGGYVWDVPPFGYFTSPNITPHPENGIGRFRPEEVARAIQTGVRPDGTIGTMMLFGTRSMADEDVEAVVAYLYSLPPVDRPVGRYEADILGKLVIKNLKPRVEAAPAFAPPGEVSVARGAYIAKGPGNCFSCHTPHDPLDGNKQVGAAMSGAAQPDPDIENTKMEFHAPNLTPDPDTGHLRDWDEAKFVERFSAPEAYPSTSMPWGSYMGLSLEDKKSLWRYLQSLKPVKRNTGALYREAGSFAPDPAI